MFENLKKVLGIEDVKIELVVSNSPDIKSGKIYGTVLISSYNDSTVESIAIKLIEKYTRGRKDNKLIDEYVIGFVDIDERVHVKKGETIELPFTLPFVLAKSEMDHYEQKNFFYKGIIKAAKALKGVKSEFTIMAEAFVKGTKLHPHAKKIIEIG